MLTWTGNRNRSTLGVTRQYSLYLHLQSFPPPPQVSNLEGCGIHVRRIGFVCRLAQSKCGLGIDPCDLVSLASHLTVIGATRPPRNNVVIYYSVRPHLDYPISSVLGIKYIIACDERELRSPQDHTKRRIDTRALLGPVTAAGKTRKHPNNRTTGNFMGRTKILIVATPACP